MNTFGDSVCTTTHECHLTEHKCVVVHPKLIESYVEGIYRYDYISIDNRLTEIHVECIDKDITAVTELPKLDKHLPANMTDITLSFKEMFAYCKRLTDISLLGSLPVDNARSLSSFFSWCEELNDISALSNWDVSKIETFDYMFSGCRSIDHFSPISNWNVSSAISLTEMFNCTSATVDDIKDWCPRANCNVYHFLDDMHDDVDNDIDIYYKCPWIGICILTDYLHMDVCRYPDFPSLTAREIYEAIVDYITPDHYKWIRDSKNKNDTVKRKPAPRYRYRIINEPHKYNGDFTGDIILVDKTISVSVESRHEPYSRKPSKRIRLETATDCFELCECYDHKIIARIDK